MDRGRAFPRRPFHPVLIHLVTTVVAGVLYYATAIPGLAWGDSGNVQVRVLSGIIHDPDDPSRSHIPFYVMASALTRLGVEPHRAATLLSAFAGAVTIGNVACILTLLCRTRRAVVAATILSMFSHSIWSLAAVPEVMTLSSALFTFELIVIILFLKRGERALLCLAFFLNGLGAATHNMAVLTCPAYVVMLFAHNRRETPVGGRDIAMGIAAWVVGAAPLVWLFIKTSTATGSATAALSDMLAGRFAFAVFNTGSLPRLFLRTVAYTVYSFPTPLIFCAVTGCAHLWRRADRRMMLFVSMALLFQGLFVARYNVPDQHTFMAQMLILLLLFAAVGLDEFCEARPAGIVPTAALIALACPAILVYSATPHFLRRYWPESTVVPTRFIPHRDSLDWFLKPWRNGDDGAQRFARDVLRDIPSNVVLAVDSTLMPPILYLQIDEELRRDVQIVSAHTYQTWLPDEFRLDEPAARNEAIAAGRLYSGTDDSSALNPHLRDPRYSFRPSGVVFLVFDSTPDGSSGAPR